MVSGAFFPLYVRAHTHTHADTVRPPSLLTSVAMVTGGSEMMALRLVRASFKNWRCAAGAQIFLLPSSWRLSASFLQRAAYHLMSVKESRVLFLSNLSSPTPLYIILQYSFAVSGLTHTTAGIKALLTMTQDLPGFKLHRRGLFFLSCT